LTQSPTGELAGDGGKDRTSLCKKLAPLHFAVGLFLFFKLLRKSCASTLTWLVIQKAS
jgi:hypothetical protein